MKLKRILLIIFFVLLIFSAIGIKIVFFSSNVLRTKRIYIPHNSTFSQVLDILSRDDVIKDIKTLRLAMYMRKYPRMIKSGSYVLKIGMNNWQIINKLRGGVQDPVNLTFNNIRTKEELAGKISKKLEMDSLTLLKALKDTALYAKYGFNRFNILAMFIPNTYRIYWNISPKAFIYRMYKEYKRFWNSERLTKAHKKNLKPVEVIILASIVQAEQAQHPDERPLIASVYLNRLKKGMHLEADPTVIYAIGDFSIKRVLKDMLNIDSPYNTYKYFGLPPGPILTPDISSIDAVLNAPNTNYLYFCAKDDFSGYHYFSSTYKQHLIYARKYQQALNKRKIYR